MTIRLVVYLARAGAASRRGAGDLVKSGRVIVNGEVCENPATQIDPDRDHVRVDDKLIKKLEPFVYIMFNKPAGVVTTRSDPEGRPTVFDFLTRVKCQVQAVGRLDYDTEGLLLFTNDGTLANRLMRPASKVWKTYQARVTGEASPKILKQLSQGVALNERNTLPAKVELLERESGGAHIMISVVEGRYRQVRRMCETVGLTVKKLRRTAYGPLELGDLAPCSFRYLKDEELNLLRRDVAL